MLQLRDTRGITLIGLIVTIIVLLILAGVTLSFVAGENGILKRATTAVEVNEKTSAEEEANLLVANIVTQYYEEKYVNHKDLKELDEYIKKELITEKATATGNYRVVSDENKNVQVLRDEKVIAKGEIIDGKIEWSSENISDTKPIKPENPTAGKEDTSKNRDLAGATTNYSYKNPIIPQGFLAIDTTDAKWEYTDTNKTVVKGWIEGLVIQDEIGNQFVWVPVDGTNVKYEKWCTMGKLYSECSDDINAIPVTQTDQINTYQGFYVARYEAGLGTNTMSHSVSLNNVYTEIPVSKAGSKVWNFIDYEHSCAVAEKMVNNSEIYGNNKSGLITGTQWDTIMKWYENASIKVDATQDWGTYYNFAYNGNDIYFTFTNSYSAWKTGSFSHVAGSTSTYHYHASGINTNGIKKNIADMGGNLHEWTSEVCSSNRINRGGNAGVSSVNHAVSYRESIALTSTSYRLGFRCVLYVQ